MDLPDIEYKHFPLAEENQALKKQLSEMQKTLNEQSAAIAKLQADFDTTTSKQNEILAKQTEYLEKLVAKICEPKARGLDIFPFQNIKEMEEFEQSIATRDKFQLMQYIKNLIGKTNISKCMHKIFMSECLLEVNWDGKYNKIPMRNTQLFSKLLYDAVQADNYNYDDYVKDVRKGFRYAKNKEYRIKFQKNNSLNAEDPLLTF